MFINHKSVILLTSLTSMLIIGCSEKNSTSTGTQKPISLDFIAEANNQSLSCNANILGLGTAGTDATLEDFRFYIHNLRLLKDTGEEVAVSLEKNQWQTESVALVDFQDKSDKCQGANKEVHTSVTGTYLDDNNSTFTGVRFTVGIPEELNHKNPTEAVSPLNIVSLQWSWQLGYKFMRLDVSPIGGVSRSTDSNYSGSSWNIHLGSTSCTGSPELGEIVICNRMNKPEITLNNFNLGVSKIVIDYSVLTESSILGLDEGGSPGCQSGVTDPECDAVFSRLGLNLETGGTNNANVQTIFSVR